MLALIPWWMKAIVAALVVAVIFGAGYHTAENHWKVREAALVEAAKDRQIADLKLKADLSAALVETISKVEAFAADQVQAMQEKVDAAETEARAVPAAQRICRDLTSDELGRLRNLVLPRPGGRSGKADHPARKR